MHQLPADEVGRKTRWQFTKRCRFPRLCMVLSKRRKTTKRISQAQVFDIENDAESAVKVPVLFAWDVQRTLVTAVTGLSLCAALWRRTHAFTITIRRSHMMTTNRVAHVIAERYTRNDTVLSFVSFVDWSYNHVHLYGAFFALIWWCLTPLAV